MQLTAWEVLYLHLWASGKLPSYASDAEWLATPRGAAAFVGWTLALPVLHDVHFYFIHRFIHVRPLYQFVHSLHHRNVDIEPFCGLAMHPIEHLFFFSLLGLGSICAQAVNQSYTPPSTEDRPTRLHTASC